MSLGTTATRTPPKPTVATTEEMDLMHRSNNKSKMQQCNPNDSMVENNMKDTYGVKDNHAPSFKEALMAVTGIESINDACWSELLNTEAPTNIGHKETEEAHTVTTKTLSPDPIINVTDEELNDWAKPWKNTLIVKMLGTTRYNAYN